MERNTTTPRVHRTRWAVVLLTMAATLAVWTVLVPLAGIDVQVTTGGGAPRDVTHLEVTLASLGSGLLGWALLTVLERVTRHGRRIWLGVAGAVLVLSLPGTAAATTPAGTGVLVALHLVVGVMLLTGLGSSGASARRGAEEEARTPHDASTDVLTRSR